MSPVNHLPVRQEERPDVVLLAFADQILKALQEKAKPGTSRYTRIEEARRRIARVDETYHGYLPETIQEKAETFLEEIERKIVELNEL